MLTAPAPDTSQLAPDVELHLCGAIGGASLSALAEELAHALQLRPENLILHARACTGLDPDAIRLLLTACAEARGMGSHIILHHPKPELIRSLAMAGVLRWLIVDYLDVGVAPGQSAPVSAGAHRGPLMRVLHRHLPGR